MSITTQQTKNSPIQNTHLQSNQISYELKPMAFVNEYVPDDDIKKYKLDEQIMRWKGWLPPELRHSWTIDREREIYFRRIATGREDDANRITWILFYKGSELEVYLRLMPGSSTKLSSSPYRIIWALERISHPLGDALPKEELIQIIKEALTTYGYGGIRRQIPNTIVEFNF